MPSDFTNIIEASFLGIFGVFTDRRIFDFLDEKSELVSPVFLVDELDRRGNRSAFMIRDLRYSSSAC